MVKKALVAQRLEQGTHNPLVAGSSPSERTIVDLRKEGLWPFPVLAGGKDVYVVQKAKKEPAPSWCKETDEALW